MKKSDINNLIIALKKASILENQLRKQIKKLANIIEDITGIAGNVDYLSGDGFGFTPLSDNDTHVSINEILKWIEEGKIITEEFILDRLSF